MMRMVMRMKTRLLRVQYKRKQQKDNGLSFSIGASKWYSEADNEEDAKQPIFQFESSKEIQRLGIVDMERFLQVYAHDRGDYKSRWQMEREWDEAEKERKRKLALKALNSDDEEDEPSDEDDEDGLPFACFICRKSFVDPVVTTCKHYFCEHCALKWGLFMKLGDKDLYF
ncbi:hypothetical protein QQ045_031415 [Rhodiola kirilowii]